MTYIEIVLYYFLGYIALLGGASIYTHNSLGLGTFIMAMAFLVWGFPVLKYCHSGMVD